MGLSSKILSFSAITFVLLSCKTGGMSDQSSSVADVEGGACSFVGPFSIKSTSSTKDLCLQVKNLSNTSDLGVEWANCASNDPRQNWEAFSCATSSYLIIRIAQAGGWTNYLKFESAKGFSTAYLPAYKKSFFEYVDDKSKRDLNDPRFIKSHHFLKFNAPITPERDEHRLTLGFEENSQYWCLNTPNVAEPRVIATPASMQFSVKNPDNNNCVVLDEVKENRDRQ